MGLLSEIPPQLKISRNERAIVVVIIYPLKSRVILLRAARCLTPCDKLSSPWSVILLQLIIRNKISNNYSYNLLDKVKSDCK